MAGQKPKTINPRERDRRIQHPRAQRLIKAAHRLVYKNGVEATRIMDVEEAAGMTNGMCFYFFGSKARLLAEVLAIDHRKRLETMRAHLEPASNGEELLAAMNATLRALLVGDRKLGNFEVCEEIGILVAGDREMRYIRAEQYRAYRETLARILLAKTNEGMIAPPLEVVLTATMLIAVAQGLATTALTDQDWDPDAGIEATAVMTRPLLGLAIAP